jgi:4-hydroxybenzoate polyprenyltransferase
MLPRIIQVSRPVLWINAIGPAIIALWLSGELWDWRILPLLLWLSLPFNLLIYGINDVFDIDTDELNTRKGGLEGARISLAERKSILTWVILLNLPFLLAFPFIYPLPAILWMAAYALVFVAYSSPPLRLKARPFLDSVSNAGYAFPLIFASLALEQPVHWVAAIGLMVWSMAKHSFDAIQDISLDRGANLTTTAVLLGVKGTLIWSGALWVAATALFAAINIPLAIANLMLAGYLIIAAWRSPTEATANRLYPVSIAFPYLAGAVAGVQLCAAILLGVAS